jgi:tetratricopeptide (TPR) repeat protein
MAEHTAAVQQRLQASGITAEDDVALLLQLLDLPVAPECLARLNPEARLQALVAQAGGNPFFVEELAWHAVEQGGTRRRPYPRRYTPCWQRAWTGCHRGTFPADADGPPRGAARPVLPWRYPSCDPGAGLMVQCLRELGEFAAGMAYGDEACQMAEALGRPYERTTVAFRVGQLQVRQGTLRQAIPRLEWAVALSQEADLPNLYRLAATQLALAYALAGRVTDALPLQTQVGEITYPYFYQQAVYWGETSLLAGDVEEAHRLAQQGFAGAREHNMRGWETRALWLLGEIALHRDPPDIALAAAHYQQALALAEELGICPLVAHCHFGLGTLYATTGQHEQARAALSTAIEMYRAMAMTLWLPQAEAALAQIREGETALAC